MSEERIIKALKGFGLSVIDTRVYLFLAKKGSCSIRKSAKELNLNPRILDKSLKELSNLGIIHFSIKDPSKFTAMPFEDVIDVFIEVKKEQAKKMQESREELLSNWNTILKKNSAK
jgi:sugar-specific transcriptional regulator TrmB